MTISGSGVHVALGPKLQGAHGRPCAGAYRIKFRYCRGRTRGPIRKQTRRPVVRFRPPGQHQARSSGEASSDFCKPVVSSQTRTVASAPQVANFPEVQAMSRQRPCGLVPKYRTCAKPHYTESAPRPPRHPSLSGRHRNGNDGASCFASMRKSAKPGTTAHTHHPLL